MSTKTKLLTKLRNGRGVFTWGDATTLMGACGFTLHNARGGGSGRTFVHRTTGTLVRLHEPHPQNNLLPYMRKNLLIGLATAREINDEV